MFPSRAIDLKVSRPIQRDVVQLHPIAAAVVDAPSGGKVQIDL